MLPEPVTLVLSRPHHNSCALSTAVALFTATSLLLCSSFLPSPSVLYSSFWIYSFFSLQQMKEAFCNVVSWAVHGANVCCCKAGIMNESRSRITVSREILQSMNCIETFRCEPLDGAASVNYRLNSIKPSDGELLLTPVQLSCQKHPCWVFIEEYLAHYVTVLLPLKEL